MNLMLNKTANSISPLWLALACNELRVFGKNIFELKECEWKYETREI